MGAEKEKDRSGNAHELSDREQTEARSSKRKERGVERESNKRKEEPIKLTIEVRVRNRQGYEGHNNGARN